MINPLLFVPEITVDNLQFVISIWKITERVDTNLSTCLSKKNIFFRYKHYNIYLHFFF